MEHCNSSAEKKVPDNLLCCKDAELVYRWMHTLFIISKRRMVICTLHFDLPTQVTLYMPINMDGKHGYKRM